MAKRFLTPVELTSVSNSAGDILTISSGIISVRTAAQILTDIGAAASSHNHSASDINSGRLALDRLPTSSTANRVLRVGTANSSPVFGQVDYSELSGVPASFTPSSHSHAIADVTGLSGALDGKASTSHSHSASDITSGTLNIARIPTGSTSSTVALGDHNHTIQSLSGVFGTPGNGKMLYYNEGEWVIADPATIGIPTLTDPNVFTRGQTFNDGTTISITTGTDWSSGLTVRKRGSTVSDSSAVASGGEVGYHVFSSWDGSDYGRNAHAIVRATQNQSTGNHGASYGIAVTANGSASPTLQFLLDHNGYLGLGTSSPTERLHVQGNIVVGGSYVRAPTPASGNDSDLVNRKFLSDGYATLSHSHAATDITSGTLPDARLSGNVVMTSGNQTLGGTKTFSSIPILPASSPSADNEATRKKYVDDGLAGKANTSHSHSTSDITSGTLSVARGGTGLATLTSGSFLVGNGTSSVTLRTAAQVLGDIGAAASSHTHNASDINAGTLAIARIPTGSTSSTVSLGNHNHTFDSLSNVTISSVATGHLVRWNGSAWVNATLAAAGVAASSHNHAASDINSGTLDIARIPTGSTSSTVSLGNHSHTLNNLTNVTISSPSSGQVLSYNGTAWINAAPSSGGGSSWSTVTSATSISPGNNYVSNGSTRISFSLPATSAAGDTFRIAGVGAGGFRITQGAGQQVIFGNVSTTSGSSGYTDSTHRRDCVEMVCTAANTTWQVISAVGTLDLE